MLNILKPEEQLATEYVKASAVALSTTRRTESTFFVRQKLIHKVLFFRGVLERARRHGSIRFVHFHRFPCEKRIVLLPLPWLLCSVCRACYACYVF